MRTIYFLDTAIPIPNKDSVIHSYKDVISKPVEDLNISYTVPVLTWVGEEFDKILKNIGISTKFDFSNIAVTFFISQYFNTPEACFSAKEGLISIKLDSDFCTGRESNIQQSTIHEFVHAVTASTHLVGTTVAEGIALYFEKLYCQFYGITDDTKRDEGYVFSENLINSIILNVYNSNLDTFFERIKKGNEREFINDIDIYLKSQNIGYSANELLRLSSILFYAKKLPRNPFEEYHKNSEMEQLRKDILQCFSGRETIDLNRKINDYSTAIRYIVNLYDKVYSKYTGDLNTFSNTFDRELGLAMVNDNNFPLQLEIVKNVYKKTANIINTHSTIETNISLPNNDAHSDYDSR